MIYLITKEGQFLKRSYDSWNGHWTSDPTRAVPFKTRKGAERAAEKRRDYLRSTGRETIARLVQVAPASSPQETDR